MSRLSILAPAVATVLVAAGLASSAQEPRPTFDAWLAEVRAEAVARGIREDVVARALAGIEEPMPVVLERDRTQAEIVLPLETYLARRLTSRVVRTGRQMTVRHQRLLAQISAKYGVPGAVVVAIWGNESNFGRFSGVRPTIPSLATLAWDPRRSTLFRSELFHALDILNRGDIELGKMRGSWAGAMGQPQFMPSSYLQFAEDFDGDGRRNIWDSPPDIFASVANYLKGHGWVAGRRWGREVTFATDAARQAAAEVPRREATRCRAARSMSMRMPLAKWDALGVRTFDRRPLPAADLDASLVSGATRHFLVYENYDALLEYNCAHAYALHVGLLSDRLAG